MRRSICLLITSILFVAVFSSGKITSAYANEEIEDFSAYEKTEKKIKSVLGMDESLSSIGYLEENDDGVLYLKLVENKKMKRSKEFVQLLGELKEDGVLIEEDLKYAPDDIDALEDSILKEIKEHYNNQIPEDLIFKTTKKYKEQKVVITQGVFKERSLDVVLINRLIAKYPEVVQFKKTEEIKAFEGWNYSSKSLVIAALRVLPERYYIKILDILF